MLFAAIKMVHLLALLALFAASIVKNIWLTPSAVTAHDLALCRSADRCSGAAAGVVVVSGLALLIFSPKGAAFYTSNAFFWLKIAVLVVASAFIVRTKLFFRTHAQAGSGHAVDLPSWVRRTVRGDAWSLVFMTALAVLVVNHLGVFW